jgi:hypothetical protein
VQTIRQRFASYTPIPMGCLSALLLIALLASTMVAAVLRGR